jgi:hypothetical protein
MGTSFPSNARRPRTIYARGAVDRAPSVSKWEIMIVSAHQPYFLPWLAFFDKIARSDLFVVLDHVQYGSESFQNRNRIKLADGAHWITVPVLRRGLGERICDKAIANGASTRDDWGRRVWRTLEQSYRRAPHFALYRDALAEVFSSRWERLLDLNLELLRRVLGWLDIRTPMVRSSTLGLEKQKTELLGELCAYFGADVYLSGVGGARDYLDVPALAAQGVRVAWHQFSHPVYPQQHMALGFLPELSVIDLILNCGPESGARLLGEQPPPCVAARSADAL